MIEIKIITLILCAACFWVGGAFWLPARRFIMPFFLTLECLYISHWDWYCLTMLACMGVFCLGYGDKSPLRHIFGNGWGRGVWGLLGAITLSLGLFLTGHLWVVWMTIYLGLNFILENALKDIPQFIGDPIIGLGFASLVFLIH